VDVALVPSRRLAAARATWWLTLYGLWFLFAGKIDSVEAVAGAVAATLGLVAATVVRDRLADPVGVDHTWLTELVRVPRRVALDWVDLVVALRRALARQPSLSSFRSFPYQPTRAGPPARSRAALTIFAGSIAPNAYVLTIDRANRTAEVHMLIERDASPLPSVAQRVT
jgi:hypothetical protein